MSGSIKVVSVNISEEKGVAKHPVPVARVDEMGLVGDAHAGPWHRQVSLLGQESIDRFVAETNRKVKPGEFAENITLSGTDLSEAAVLDHFRIGQIRLEVTQIGKACHGDRCAIYQTVGKCVMPKEGIFCRVVHGGTVRPGDAARHLPRELTFRVITLSDRAAAGQYEDRSGPRIKASLEEFLSGSRWRGRIDAAVLPDDAARLKAALLEARDSGVDAVFTTGGTGLGPRDIAPQTAAEVCDRLIPGIMEHIRVKFGSQNPNALLSRGVAGMAGKTQVYTLPGSERAVEEYMAEILKTLEHVIFMVHGLDVHRTRGRP